MNKSVQGMSVQFITKILSKLHRDLNIISTLQNNTNLIGFMTSETFRQHCSSGLHMHVPGSKNKYSKIHVVDILEYILKWALKHSRLHGTKSRQSINKSCLVKRTNVHSQIQYNLMITWSWTRIKWRRHLN